MRACGLVFQVVSVSAFDTNYSSFSRVILALCAIRHAGKAVTISIDIHTILANSLAGRSGRVKEVARQTLQAFGGAKTVQTSISALEASVCRCRVRCLWAHIQALPLVQIIETLHVGLAERTHKSVVRYTRRAIVLGGAGAARAHAIAGLATQGCYIKKVDRQTDTLISGRQGSENRR